MFFLEMECFVHGQDNWNDEIITDITELSCEKHASISEFN